MRSWPKTLGNRLYGSLSTLLGISRAAPDGLRLRPHPAGDLADQVDTDLEPGGLAGLGGVAELLGLLLQVDDALVGGLGQRLGTGDGQRLARRSEPRVLERGAERAAQARQAPATRSSARGPSISPRLGGRRLKSQTS